MPALLVGVVRYPPAYSPWYIANATLIASPASFTFGDILFPDASGNFDQLVTTDAVLTAGYVIALEAFVTGMTVCQVAIPGSVIAFPVDTTVRPCGLVKFVFSGGVQSITAAAAADLAAGKVLGRMRQHYQDHENLRLPSANDIVLVNTGLC